MTRGEETHGVMSHRGEVGSGQARSGGMRGVEELYRSAGETSGPSELLRQ